MIASQQRLSRSTLSTLLRWFSILTGFEIRRWAGAFVLQRQNRWNKSRCHPSSPRMTLRPQHSISQRSVPSSNDDRFKATSRSVWDSIPRRDLLPFHLLPGADGDSQHCSWIGAAVSMMFLVPASTEALTPNQAADDYNRYAPTYDELDGDSTVSSFLGIEQARMQLLAQARGHVLEIGVGTGLNFDKYNTQNIQSLTVVDISDGMLSQAQKRIMSRPSLQEIPVTFLKADATSELVSRFGMASFDTVVDTFSLCVMGNEGARKCLDQIQKVVKPGSGRILLLENARSSMPFVGWYQDVTAETAAMAGGKGCIYNQDVATLIQQAGIIVESEQEYVAGLFRSFVCRTT